MKKYVLPIVLLSFGVCAVLALSAGSEAVAGETRTRAAVEKIAFYSNRSGTPQIYIMDADGGNLQRLTNNSAGDRSPVISPDGTRIAFASDRDGESRIYVMDIDGGNQRRLTDTDHVEILPAWSPDGATIYFQIEFKGENSVLCAASAGGGDFRRITDGSAGYDYAMISPDGKRILCNGRGLRASVMNVDGSEPRDVGEAGAMRMRPCWSPDGKRIAYGLLRGMPPNHTTEIAVMDADGGNDTVITEDDSVNEFPCWSPDGKKIAFQTARDGNFEIYVMNADGTDPRRLTDHPGFDGAPSWGVVVTPPETPGNE